MKTIVVSFDGTEKTPEDAIQEKTMFGFGDHEDNSVTNVLKLHLMLGGDLDNNNGFKNQETFYYKGIGSYGNSLKRFINRLVAPECSDYKDILKEAYKDVSSVYNSGDKIVVIGFSRGAAIGRVFADNIKDKLKNSPEKPIDLLLAFDTVASIGAPNLDDNTRAVSDVPFKKGHEVSPSVKKAFHLLALDETRNAFTPTLMNYPSKAEEPSLSGPKVNEVWFSGVHSDIGGGYRKDDSSDITLTFAKNILKHNTELKMLSPEKIHYDRMVVNKEGDTIDYDDVKLNANTKGMIHHHSETFLYKFLEGWSHSERKVHRLKNDKPLSNYEHPPLLHHSVIERMTQDKNYKPLPEINKHRVLHYDGRITSHMSLDEHYPIELKNNTNRRRLRVG